MKCMTLIPVLMALTSVPSARAQQPAEAAQEQRALEFIRMIQAGDAQRLLEFMHANWVPAGDDSEREARWPRFARTVTERHGETEIAGVTIERAGELTVETRDPDGTSLRFIFEFEMESPYRIVSLGLEAGPGRDAADLPELEIPADAGPDRIAAILSAWFDGLAAADKFSGTALVAWQSEPIFQGAWGLASKRWDVPNTLDTRFDLGSINKSFTKIAIGQLMAEGRLAPDDVIADHLSDYPNSAVAQKVTVRHLLEHSGGLGDIFTEEFFASDKSQYRQPKDFFWLFAEKEPEFEPGSRSSYSNAGFMVLGAIIAEVSGAPYDKYVREHIFEPAGMDRAGFFAHDEPVPNVAEGYTRRGFDGEPGEWRSNVLMMPARGNSAGSAQATVRDLLNFDDALREYRLLPYEYTRWYFGGAEPEDQESSEPPGRRAGAAIGIAGGAPGVSACVESDADLVVIILSNYDAPIAEHVARQLFRPLARVFAVDR